MYWEDHMLDIGFYHPLIIHFAISLVLLGVFFRIASLTGRVPFTGPAATILILLGAAAVIVAARSGEDAHVAVEAIPGIAAAVKAHQTWGERTRNIVLLLASVEILALILARRGRARPALLASGALGLASALCIMQTGKLGGELVYAHAGGIGIRSGDSEDVGRLLLAGLYHQAQLDERAGKSDEAATLLELAARLFPSDPAVQLLAAESLFTNRRDPGAALTALDRIAVPKEERRLRFHQGWLTADALTALGWTEAARAALQKLQSEFPDSERLRRRLEQTSKNAREQPHPQRGIS
jgi:uncharacterized membrane protein